MIDFTTVTKDICIFYLGGVAGDKGPLLNILKTSDNHYYFNYFVYDALLNKDQQTQFLKEVGSYEAEIVLNENWLTWTDYPEKRPQINYYKSLKTDHERQIYATAIGQQIALNWLYRPLHELLTVYDINCLNSFIETIEFKLT